MKIQVYSFLYDLFDIISDYFVRLRNYFSQRFIDAVIDKCRKEDKND